MEEFTFENKNIIILSPEKWGKNHISKHHYAKELAKKNKVWFVESCGETSLNLNTTLIDSGIVNLSIIKYKHTLKGRRFLPKKIISFLEKKIVDRILKKIDNKIDLVWSFDQFRFLNLNQFGAKIKIFHPVDITNSPWSLKSFIANSADIIFHVSDYIVEDIQTKKPIYFIQHGLSEEFINPSKVDKPSYIIENKINIGYVGNLINSFIDWQSLLKAVKDNKDLNFVFIGPFQKSNISGKLKNEEKINELKALKNVILTGEIESKYLANILIHFDVFWLCYDTIKYEKRVSNSHKVIEYLSTGKPVISNKIRMYDKSKLLIQVDNNTEISQVIKKVSNNLSAYNIEEIKKKKIEYAKMHTYKNNLNTVAKFINQLCVK
jgi:hypothetical protein